MPLCHRLLILFVFLSAPLALTGRPADADAERTALAVDTLTRLPATNLNSNPKLAETVRRVLEKTRGTANFVRLVQHFRIPNQNAGLLEVVIAQPPGEASVDATRLILANGGSGLLQQILSGTNGTAALRVAEALGHTADKQANALLVPLVQDPARDAGLRRQAVRALAGTAEGARELIRLARDGTLSADLRFTAGVALSQVRWAEVKSEAAAVLPPLQGQNAQPLPALAQLLTMKGDPHNGARLFTNANPGCAACHVVRGHGTELGPDLSEIGTKLGKDALYEAILEPSSGISFGYEAFNVVLKNGDEAYGLIASETAEEVAVKTVGGLQTKLKKTDIASRQISKLSLMPSGLQVALTPQELVDLVEYLTSLKKP